jgi:hypothetical protein
MTCTCECHNTRGHRINRKATVGARLVSLATVIAETEKLARKTPPKTLFAERIRVENAKGILAKLLAERATLLEEQATLEALDRPETDLPREKKL